MTDKSRLVKKRIRVTRGGKTFEQERMVRSDEAVKGADSPLKSSSSDDVTLPPADLERLTKLAEQASRIKPGKLGKVAGIPFTGLASGFFGVKVSGKKIVIHSARGVALVADKLSSLVSTGGALMMGDLQGSTVKQGIGVRSVEAKVERKISQIARDRAKANKLKVRDKEQKLITKRREASLRTKEQLQVIQAKETAKAFSDDDINKLPHTRAIAIARKLGVPTADPKGNVFKEATLKRLLRSKVKELVDNP